MQFIQARSAYCGGNNRHQTCFSTPDEQVSADNGVRLIAAFIDVPLGFLQHTLQTISNLRDIPALNKEFVKADVNYRQRLSLAIGSCFIVMPQL